MEDVGVLLPLLRLLLVVRVIEGVRRVPDLQDETGRDGDCDVRQGTDATVLRFCVRASLKLRALMLHCALCAVRTRTCLCGAGASHCSGRAICCPCPFSLAPIAPSRLPRLTDTSLSSITSTEPPGTRTPLYVRPYLPEQQVAGGRARRGCRLAWLCPCPQLCGVVLWAARPQAGARCSCTGRSVVVPAGTAPSGRRCASAAWPRPCPSGLAAG